MRAHVARFWWLVLVAFSVVTLAAGFWLETVVTHQIEQGLANELTTIRATHVAALREWLTAVKQVSTSTAMDEAVRKDALALFENAAQVTTPDELRAVSGRAELGARLDRILDVWRLDDYLVFAGQRCIASSNRELVGLPVPDREVPAGVFDGQTVIDLPHKSTAPVLADRPAIMFVVSPIKSHDGVVRGGIAFRLEPQKNFTRLLRSTKFGETGETYAYNKEGMLLSASRFEADLVREGRLRPGQSSVLAVPVRDPKGLDSPLTRAARAATQGGTGVDVAGYRDYRGVEVVGAWTWLADYEIALNTELDKVEAYRSTAVIRRATRALTAVIFLCAIVIGIGSEAFRRLNRRVRRAEQLGQYTLVSKLGEGGMGIVYRARHALLRRPTAIKVLKRDDSTDDAYTRFEREVQAMATLAHPNTVAVYDYGRTSAGTIYYAMEFLEGRSLEHLVAEVGPLPQARVIHIVLQILASLGEAHGLGLVHRDVKPANVMLCRRGGVADMVKVVDFGLVKRFAGKDESLLTAVNVVVGTPLYMAPESHHDPQNVDHRSDLYAVGAVAYFLLAGIPVFDADSLVAIIAKHLTQAPAPLTGRVDGIVPELDALILQSLAKSRDDRPSSTAEMIERLEAIRKQHGLDWSPREADAWWDAHPAVTSSAAAAVDGSALEVDLEARSSPAAPRAAWVSGPES